MLTNKKFIISLNQEIGETGEFANESSLDFALNILKHKKSWLYELSYLIRSLLVDHVFRDGNKRTSFVLIASYIKEKEFLCDKDELKNTVLKIAKKNITDINKITRLINNVIYK